MNSLNHEDILNDIRNDIIQSIAENMDLYGITDTIGRLYGTLYFSNRPLNLDEMREALGMSKTSMSNGVRSLLESKMVRKVWRKGERKDIYQAEDDWYKTFSAHFSTKWFDAIEDNLKTINDAEKKYEKLLKDSNIKLEIKEEVENDLNKIKEIKLYYKWLIKLINTFESGEIFDLIPKPKE